MIDGPYKGLAPYQEGDQEIFFGRETQIKSITDSLRAYRVTVLYGGSGVGKSSVLRAGVAATIRQQASYNLKRYQAPLVAVVVFPPLNGSWKGDIEVDLRKQIEIDVKAIAPDIQAPSPTLSFVDALEEWTQRMGTGEDKGKLTIILDQFEEFFMTHSQEQEEGAYLEAVAGAVNRFGLRVNFLLSIRTNAFTQLDRFKALIPGLMDKRIELKRLDRPSAEDAIREPLEVYNQRFPEQRIRIEKELVEEVLDNVKAAKEDGIEASYLQLVMKRLWAQERKQGSPKLQLQTLLDVGGTGHVVEDHFKQQMEGLDWQLAENLFHYLVTPSGDRITQKAEDLVAYVNSGRASDQEKLQLDSVKRLLERLSFGTARILRALAGDGYEVFFGILGEVVAKWLRTRVQIRRLGQDAEKAWQDFDFSQLGALHSAVKAGEALQNIIEEDEDWAKDPATIAVRRTLQVILENIREEWLFKHQNSPIYGASISAEGKLATASFDGTVRVWDLENFQEEASKEFRDPSTSVFYVTFSADGQQLATGSWDGTVRLWDLEGNQLLSEPLGKPGEPAVSSVSFSLNGRQLAIASLDGIIRLWNLQGSPSELQHVNPGALAPFVHSLSFLSQGEQLVVAYWDGSAYLWDWPKNKLFRLGEHETQSEETQAQFGESQLLAIGAENGLVSLWDAANPTRKATEKFKAHNAPICHASYDATTDQLDTVSWDGNVRRWYLKDKTWRQFSCNRSPVYRGSFSPDRKRLVTVASDGGAHLWSLTDDYSSRLGADQLAVVQAGQAAVFCVSFSSHGTLATASLDQTVRLYNSQGEPIADPLRFESPVYRVSFSPDGRYLGIALADPQGTACLLHIDSGTQIEYSKHKQTVYCVSFSRDSDRIASASGDGTVQLWDLQGNSLQAPLSPQKGTIYYVSFSPDAQKLAMAFVDGTVGLWDFQSSHKTECMGHASVAFCLDFSPDGKLLATASGDGTVRLWDLEGNEKAKFRHESTVYWVSFSGDGELLATASGDGKTCLWQVKDAKEIAEFRHHEASVYSVCFSPDGQQLATASQDGTVKLRRIEKLEQLLVRGRERLKGAFG